MREAFPRATVFLAIYLEEDCVTAEHASFLDIEALDGGLDLDEINFSFHVFSGLGLHEVANSYLWYILDLCDLEGLEFINELKTSQGASGLVSTWACFLKRLLLL